MEPSLRLLVKLSKVLLNVNEFGWGQMHEAGHARQQYPWTWNDLRGMGEVTNNLYSLVAFKKIYPNIPTRLDTEGDYNRAFAYLKQTNKEYKNIDDLFVKLVMLWQLHLAYGDDFIQISTNYIVRYQRINFPKQTRIKYRHLFTIHRK